MYNIVADDKSIYIIYIIYFNIHVNNIQHFIIFYFAYNKTFGTSDINNYIQKCSKINILMLLLVLMSNLCY